MKIKNNILSEFIKATSLANEHAITECKLDFNEKGLTITAVGDGNSIMVRGQLPVQSFEDYAEMGKIGIINYSELLKVLGALKEDVTIEKQGNVLVFKGGRTVEVPLADESLIADNDKTPNLSYDCSFVVNKDVFNDVEKNLAFVMNTSDSAIVLFEGENKVLNIKYGSKYKFTDAVKVDEITDKISVKFGQPLINALHNLSGDLTIQMKSDFPITIMKKTDMYAVKIIVAPKV